MSLRMEDFPLQALNESDRDTDSPPSEGERDVQDEPSVPRRLSTFLVQTQSTFPRGTGSEPPAAKRPRLKNKLVDSARTHDVLDTPKLSDSKEHTPSFYTWPMLLDLAGRSWRQNHPDWNPAIDDEQPQPTTQNYADMDSLQLTRLSQERGLLGKPIKHRQINALQVLDARNGLFPIPRPENVSEYHNMYSHTLQALGSDRGYFRQGIRDLDMSAQSIVDFLIEQDKETVGPAAAFSETLDEASATMAAQLLLSDLSLAMGCKATEHSLAFSQPTVLHGTYNKGIYGSYEALSSLGQTLMHNHFPTPTPSRGLRSGVEALARSIRATRSTLFQRDMRRESTTHITADDMMRALFVDYVPGEVAESYATATPTTKYAAYLERTIGHFRHEDLAVYNKYFHIYTVRNNLNVLQLIAIIELLRESEQIEDDFGLGIVVGAHLHVQADDTTMDHAANARIVREGRNEAPNLWLYHNIAIGGADYNHFEGFDGFGRLNNAIEWGMRIGDAGLLPRYRPLKQDSESTAPRSKAEKLQAALKSAQTALSVYRRAMARACLRCREKERTDCQRVLGHQHCNNCDPGNCDWPEGTILFPTIHKGAQTYTDEERLDWDSPAHNLDDILELAQKCKPDIHPTVQTGKHFWVIFSARASSNPTWARLQQMLAALVQTQHYYDVMLNQPNPQGHAEYTRPGGPGTPMFVYRQAIARHGNKMIPTHLGNLFDPYLMTFVNLINWIADPINPLPEELHIVLHGVPGFAVDITAWGDRTQGFFHHIFTRRPALAERIYVVPLVEKHVVNGIGPESLDGPAYGAPAPHPPAPHWLLYRNKYLLKLKLVDLIDRAHTIKSTAVANNLAALYGMPAFPMPAWPGHRGGAIMQDKLDRLILAMYDEKALRANWLDNTTTPTCAEMMQRNHSRNLGMR